MHLSWSVAVVVVPVEAGGARARGRGEGAHRDGVAYVELAGRGDAALVHLAQEDAGRDVQDFLHLDPAADRETVQAVALHELVQGDAEADQGVEGLLRRPAPVAVLAQAPGLVAVGPARGADGLEPRDDRGEIVGLDGDALALEGELVDAHGLEGRRPRPDRAHAQFPEPLHDPADPVEMVEILREGLRRRARPRAAGSDGELYVALVEDVHDGELAAERVAAQLGGHAPELVGICLDQDGQVAWP